MYLYNILTSGPMFRRSTNKDTHQPSDSAWSCTESYRSRLRAPPSACRGAAPSRTKRGASALAWSEPALSCVWDPFYGWSTHWKNPASTRGPARKCHPAYNLERDSSQNSRQSRVILTVKHRSEQIWWTSYPVMAIWCMESLTDLSRSSIAVSAPCSPEVPSQSVLYFSSSWTHRKMSRRWGKYMHAHIHARQRPMGPSAAVGVQLTWCAACLDYLCAHLNPISWENIA